MENFVEKLIFTRNVFYQILSNYVFCLFSQKPCICRNHINMLIFHEVLLITIADKMNQDGEVNRIYTETQISEEIRTETQISEEIRTEK